MIKLYVSESSIDGLGIFTPKSIRSGKKITIVVGKVSRKQIEDENDAQSIPTWYGLGKALWIDPGKSIFRFLNHSCNPNSAIVGKRTVVARRPIKKGEEITIDYSMTDEDTLWSMQCHCGDVDCRKTIHSIQKLPSEVVKAHMPLIPKYFQTVYTEAKKD